MLAVDVEHKGGRTFGYRVTCAGSSLAYVPDALDANDDAILELASGVDVFVRGAPFVTAEQARAAEYGHGTVEHAVEIADARRRPAPRRSRTTRPTRTDDDVEAIAARAGALAATEGLELEV